MEISEDELARSVRLATSPVPSLPKHNNNDRPRYKSWRKKYRKMRARFDETLKDNVAMYKTEQRLESIAQRLQEQNDQMLDLLLDLNASLQLPASLRINVDPTWTEDDSRDHMGVEGANRRLQEVQQAIDSKTFAATNISRIREELEERVANETAARTIKDLEDQAPDLSPDVLDVAPGLYAKVDGQFGYMTSKYEDEYLRRVDAKLGDVEATEQLRSKSQAALAVGKDSEREIELNNPQSVHNWLKINKISVEADDKPEPSAEPKSAVSAKRAGGSSAKTLARKVGDRALERARDRDGVARSPVAKDFDMEDDYLAAQLSTSGKKKRGRDADDSYRPKGGGRAKPKRKREEGESGAGRKKSKTLGQDTA